MVGGNEWSGEDEGVEIGDNCESGVLFRFANLEFVFFWEIWKNGKNVTQIFPFLIEFHSWVKQHSKMFKNF